MKYVVGIEGGGTRTTCLLADGEGREVARVEVAASNHRKVGLDRARDALRAGLDGVFRVAGIDVPGSAGIAAVCAGLAGVDTEADATLMRSVFQALTSAEHILVVNDGEIALTGAFDGDPGVLVVSGTGSIVWAAAKDGRRLRIGGWDYLLGDEGSGYDVGLRSLKALSAAQDGRAGNTLLTDLVFATLGVSTFGDLVRRVYDPVLSPPEVANLAILTQQAAEEGDPIAIEILTSSATDLAWQTITAVKQAGLHKLPSFPVSAIGGLLNAGGTFRFHFEECIQGHFPNAVFEIPRHQPVEGAVRLALTQRHA